MNQPIEKMREELVRRNYAESTIRSCERIVEEFRQFIGRALDCANADDIRKYHAHLLGIRKLYPRTVVQHVAAVRFLYCKTLKRRDMKEDHWCPVKHFSRFDKKRGINRIPHSIRKNDLN